MPLTHPISLTRGGLPRVIPAFHRRLIRMGGDRGDRLVRFYLSVFSLGKLVVVAKRNDYKYASIVGSFSKEWTEVFGPLFVLYFVGMPRMSIYSIRDSHEYMGFKWLPLWSAGAVS